MIVPVHFDVSERSKRYLNDVPSITLLLIDIDHASDWRNKHGDALAQTNLLMLANSATECFSAMDSLYYGRDEFLVWISGEASEELIRAQTEAWLKSLGAFSPGSCTIVAVILDRGSHGLSLLHQNLMIAMAEAKRNSRGGIHRLQ